MQKLKRAHLLLFRTTPRARILALASVRTSSSPSRPSSQLA